MKKRNYIVAIIMAILLMLSGVGCGGSGSSGGSSGSNGSLTININDEGFGRKWADDLASGFEKETGIKVKVKPTKNLVDAIKGEFDKKAQNKNSPITVEGDLFFVALQPDQWMGWTNVGSCILEPLDNLDFVKNNKLDSSVKLWGSRIFQGESKLYVLHSNIAMETFVYNQDYLNKIPSNGEYTQGVWPETMQGFYDLCEQLVVKNNGKINGKNVVPFAWYNNKVFDLQKLYETLFAQGNGGEDYRNYFNLTADNEEDIPEETRDIFVNDSYANAMDSLTKLLRPDVKDGNGNPKYYNLFGSDKDAMEDFLSGNALCCWQGTFFETEAKGSIEDKYINLIGNNYKIGVVPAIDGNESSRTINLNFPQETFIVPSFAKNKENAKKFLDYMYRDDNLITIVKTMNIIPAVEHTYTDAEKSQLTSWGKDVVATYEKFSDKTNYPNGISFRSSSKALYRTSLLNALNFNNAGTDWYFGEEIVKIAFPSTYMRASSSEYKVLLEDFYNNFITTKWRDFYSNTHNNNKK